MYDIKGRWALVTGASRGVGQEAARFLAAHGCHLLLHARSKAHLQGIDAEARALGVETVLLEGELSDPAQVESLLAQIDRTGKTVDLVLNNAGVQIAYRTDYCATPATDYAISFQINTVAPMMLCYHFLPKMVARGTGRIVNTTSGIDLDPQQAGYSASKAALDKVTRDLGSKVEGSDVILSLADPGWCRTDLGGPQAPNDVRSVIPGIVVGALVSDGKSGRIFHAQDYADLTVEEAVRRAEAVPGVYGI